MTGSVPDEDYEDDGLSADAGRLLVTLGEDPPDRLDKALARAVPEEAALSRTRLSRMLADGDVLDSDSGLPLTDGTAKARPGQRLTLLLTAALPSEMLAEDIPLNILWEDADLIVIDKAAGMVVHPAPGSPRGTLVNALLHHFGGGLSGVGGVQRPGIVHRIDKETSGLLVVAKSDRAHHGLAAQFRDHSVVRAYIAAVYGVPSQADPRLVGLRGIGFEPGGVLRIATHLARHKTDRQKQAVVWEQGRHAITRVRLLEEFAEGAASMVECRLETGRTHQIRVHMAYAGHGLIGDPTYGGARRLQGKLPGAAAAEAFPRQALHAATLGFVHPVTGKELSFESPIPADMQALLAALRG